MRLAMISLILFVLSGCSTLGQTSTFAACSAADAASTVLVLGKGGAEANPLMSTIINRWGYLGMFAVKAALVGLVYQALKHNPDSTAVKTAVAVGSGVTCAVAAHNMGVLHSLTHSIVK